MFVFQMMEHLWAIHHHYFSWFTKITSTLFKRCPQARSNLMRWPLLHNFLQRHTFIIIDQFYRLSNMSRRRLIQMDICDKKLFPQFFILSFILLLAVESNNMEQCLLATVAIQQMLDEWIICLKCHKTVRCLVASYYLQDSEALNSSSDLTLD